MLARGAVDLPDRRSAFLRRQAVLTDIAVGADTHIQLAAVLAGHHIFGPVVVDTAARQVDHLGTGLLDRGFTRLVREAQQLVRIGDVQVVTHQGHAKR